MLPHPYDGLQKGCFPFPFDDISDVSAGLKHAAGRQSRRNSADQDEGAWVTPAALGRQAEHRIAVLLANFEEQGSRVGGVYSVAWISRSKSRRARFM